MDQYKEFKNEGKEFPQNKIVTYEKYIKIENKVEEIDENAVPLILFYQSIGTMSFEYKKIMIIQYI